MQIKKVWKVEIAETETRGLFSDWKRPSKQDPHCGLSAFKPNSDV